MVYLLPTRGQGGGIPIPFFFLHSALGPISKFSTGNHQEILQISQAGIHFLFPEKEFFNRSIIRSKFCKSKERVLYFHIRSHYFKNQMIKLF